VQIWAGPGPIRQLTEKSIVSALAEVGAAGGSDRHVENVFHISEIIFQLESNFSVGCARLSAAPRLRAP
jgi:hypothetical protein